MSDPDQFGGIRVKGIEVDDDDDNDTKHKMPTNMDIFAARLSFRVMDIDD